MSSGPPRPLKSLTELDLHLATARLTLRPIVESDIDALWPLVSDPGLSTMMSWSAHADRAETERYVRGLAAGIAEGTDVAFAIVREGALIGCVGLHGITGQRRAWRLDRAEIGYWIAEPHRRQGYVTEAALGVMKFAFETVQLHKLTIGCLVENVASRRVIEKCGFRFLARHEDDVWRDGRWWSHLRYELNFSEWSDISSTLRFSRPRPL